MLFASVRVRLRLFQLIQTVLSCIECSVALSCETNEKRITKIKWCKCETVLYLFHLKQRAKAGNVAKMEEKKNK